MEEDAFKSILQEVNERKCAFEKALLLRRFACSQSEMFYIANRRGCNCKNDLSAQRCQEVLQEIRQQSKFVLHLREIVLPLPHAHEIRVQIGGLLGLNKVIHNKVESTMDINLLIEQTLEKYPNMQNFPFNHVVSEVQKVQSRRKKKPR